jgi:hypothetical protein
MMEHYARIGDLLRRVRRRWLRLQISQAVTRAALIASAALVCALFLASWLDRAPLALILVAIATLAAIAAGAAWSFLPLREQPDDRRVARYVEERVPAFDDRLVSAVDVVRGGSDGAARSLAAPMIADTARRADAIHLDAIVPGEALRRAGFQAAAAFVACLGLLVAARRPARQAWDAAALLLFPERITLEVSPGNAEVKAGTPIAIDARLVGNRAPVLAHLEIASGDKFRAVDMTGTDGRFHADLGAVSSSFVYRVVTGSVKSPEFRVNVAHPPRVARIDVEYLFPPALGLAPRIEEDSGDIYAPSGTDVRVTIHTDRPAATGQMTLDDGKSIALSAESPTTFVAGFKVVDDNSYRVALTDDRGFSNPGDTEYFIRTLADRPPEVRIVKPAADRSVTRLEEVDIEAQADDDYGLDRMDLVYSVRGTSEKVVPLAVPRHATSATARHTLYLEDLDVQPGDFVSYYVRARDITRGKRANEAKSDIFFLEVKPYEQEFTVAQSSAMNGGGGNSIDDLVTAQKDIVVATWKLDRRALAANGVKSEQDIRAVARAEADLKVRVEQTSSTFRESTMRDPRRRSANGAPRAGETLPEEDSMTLASAAMGKAVGALEALKTSDALPPEMVALENLLKAQADVKKREISRQQAGNGSGDNNRNYDLSSLFDRELKKQQQTNYENRSSTEQHNDSNQASLDRVKELARRQDELLRRQQELAAQRARLPEDELKRQLESLTRDQLELRQQAEELSRQMTGNQNPASGQQPDQKSGGQQRSASSNSGGAGGETSRRMRDVSEEMRGAASELRRQDSGQAISRGNRALGKLRDLERQLENATPEQQRRALGELQLEARQLADAERQLSGGTGRGASAEAARDKARQLAGEQERIAERTRKLQEALKQQASTQGAPDSSTTPQGAQGGQRTKTADVRGSAADAAREIERQQLADRMQKSADQLRGGASDQQQADAQQEIARSLDRIADRLGAATGARDGDARKLSDQLARAQELKDRMAGLSREIEQLGRQRANGSSAPSPQKTPGATGRSGEGHAGSGGSGSDLADLRREYERQLRQARELVDEVRRDDPKNFSRGGEGFTYEGQGMTLSAPGTEGFKQDFARWEDLRRQATIALDAAESSLSKKLQVREAHDRLAAGADDKAPAAYQKQVDQYFKAIAARKAGGAR